MSGPPQSLCAERSLRRAENILTSDGQMVSELADVASDHRRWPLQVPLRGNLLQTLEYIGVSGQPNPSMRRLNQHLICRPPKMIQMLRIVALAIPTS